MNSGFGEDAMNGLINGIRDCKGMYESKIKPIVGKIASSEIKRNNKK